MSKKATKLHMAQHKHCTPIIRRTNDLCVPQSRCQLQKQPHNSKQELYNEHTSPLKQPSPRALITRIASALMFSIIIPTIWHRQIILPFFSLHGMSERPCLVPLPQAQFVQLVFHPSEGTASLVSLPPNNSCRVLPVQPLEFHSASDDSGRRQSSNMTTPCPSYP